MSRRKRIIYTAEQRALKWDRFPCGDHWPRNPNAGYGESQKVTRESGSTE